MRFHVLLLALASVLPAQTERQVITNQTVAEMVRAGVAADLIVEVINRSECQFHLDPANLIWLRNAGVPDDVVRAMAARAAGRSPVGGAPSAAAPVSPASGPLPAVPSQSVARPVAPSTMVVASDSVFIGGGGAGFRVYLTPRLGFDYDARVFFGQHGLFYGRTTLGLLVRLN